MEFFETVTQGHEAPEECPAIAHDPPRDVRDLLGAAEHYGGHALGTDGGDQ